MDSRRLPRGNELGHLLSNLPVLSGQSSHHGQSLVLDRKLYRQLFRRPSSHFRHACLRSFRLRERFAFRFLEQGRVRIRAHTIGRNRGIVFIWNSVSIGKKMSRAFMPCFAAALRTHAVLPLLQRNYA